MKEKCSCCEELFEPVSVLLIQDELICEDCVREHYYDCDKCGEYCYKENGYFVENEYDWMNDMNDYDDDIKYKKFAYILKQYMDKYGYHLWHCEDCMDKVLEEGEKEHRFALIQFKRGVERK